MNIRALENRLSTKEETSKESDTHYKVFVNGVPRYIPIDSKGESLNEYKSVRR